MEISFKSVVIRLQDVLVIFNNGLPKVLVYELPKERKEGNNFKIYVYLYVIIVVKSRL